MLFGLMPEQNNLDWSCGCVWSYLMYRSVKTAAGTYVRTVISKLRSGLLAHHYCIFTAEDHGARLTAHQAILRLARTFHIQGIFKSKQRPEMRGQTHDNMNFRTAVTRSPGVISHITPIPRHFISSSHSLKTLQLSFWPVTDELTAG